MDWQGWFALSLTGVALLLMSVGRFGPHLVMLGVLIVLSASGIISADQALAGFSNSGLITVVAMFVVAAGIHHSGGVDLVVHHLLRSPRTVRSAQARIAFPVALLSGFLNNTPVVATMIPAVHAWSRKIGISPSKLMIPLSYSAILGGTLTLIGTSRGPSSRVNEFSNSILIWDRIRSRYPKSPLSSTAHSVASITE